MLEKEPLGTGAGTVIGGVIWTTWSSVTTKGLVGPSTTVRIGSDELPADGMLDDAAPALEVLEAAMAAGAWTRARPYVGSSKIAAAGRSSDRHHQYSPSRSLLQYLAGAGEGD